MLNDLKSWWNTSKILNFIVDGFGIRPWEVIRRISNHCTYNIDVLSEPLWDNILRFYSTTFPSLRPLTASVTLKVALRKVSLPTFIAMSSRAWLFGIILLHSLVNSLVYLGLKFKPFLFYQSLNKLFTRCLQLVIIEDYSKYIPVVQILGTASQGMTCT